MQGFLDVALPHWSFRALRYDFGAGKYAPTVYQLTDEAARVMVISVRGTTSKYDWVQNADVWSEGVAVQIYRSLLPLSSLPVVLGPTIDKLIGTAPRLVRAVAWGEDVILARARKSQGR